MVKAGFALVLLFAVPRCRKALGQVPRCRKALGQVPRCRKALGRVPRCREALVPAFPVMPRHSAPQERLIDQVLETLKPGDALIITYGDDDEYAWEPKLKADVFCDARHYIRRDPFAGSTKHKSGMSKEMYDGFKAEDLQNASKFIRERFKRHTEAAVDRVFVVKLFCRRGIHRSVGCGYATCRDMVPLLETGCSAVLLNLGLAARWWALPEECLVYANGDGTPGVPQRFCINGTSVRHILLLLCSVFWHMTRRDVAV